MQLPFLLAGGLISCDIPTVNNENFSADNYKMDRTILPIHPPQHKVVTKMDARNVKKPDLFEIKAPEGAPNIVLVMIDDIGFGATSTFGGAIETPTLERLAENGLKFNQFHTTARRATAHFGLANFPAPSGDYHPVRG